MTHEETITAIEKRVRTMMPKEAAHDWFHVERVQRTARHIARAEGASLYIVELAALLHDIGDWKFHDGDDTVGPKMAREVMAEFKIDLPVVDHVADIIATISFKGAGVPTPMRTLEGKCAQDADRLDAIGPIGIARVFAYGGHKGTPLWDPNEKPVLHADKQSYHRSTASALGHFDEKLFHIAERMQTKTGQAMAQRRDTYMREFVTRFKKDWLIVE